MHTHLVNPSDFNAKPPPNSCPNNNIPSPIASPARQFGAPHLNANVFRLGALNCNGFHSKIGLGILDEILSPYNIICVSETLANDLDITASKLANHIPFSQSPPKNRKLQSSA